MTLHQKPWYKSTVIISVTTIASVIVAVGIILVSLGKAQDTTYKVFEPLVQKTAATVVSDSIEPCKIRLAKTEQHQSLTDTNIAVIKSILEVMATNDQLLRARDLRSNPTGIR